MKAANKKYYNYWSPVKECGGATFPLNWFPARTVQYIKLKGGPIYQTERDL